MLDKRHTEARILIVDDEMLNVKLLKLALKVAGFTNLHTTTAASEALALYSEMQPDLVVTDLHMPCLDGVALIGEIRRREASGGHVPVVVVTGDPSRDARRRALTAGAAEVLTKPFDPDELAQCLHDHLERWFGSAGPTHDASADP